MKQEKWGHAVNFIKSMVQLCYLIFSNSSSSFSLLIAASCFSLWCWSCSCRASTSESRCFSSSSRSSSFSCLAAEGKKRRHHVQCLNPASSLKGVLKKQSVFSPLIWSSVFSLSNSFRSGCIFWLCCSFKASMFFFAPWWWSSSWSRRSTFTSRVSAWHFRYHFSFFSLSNASYWLVMPSFCFPSSSYLSLNLQDKQRQHGYDQYPELNI